MPPALEVRRSAAQALSTRSCSPISPEPAHISQPELSYCNPIGGCYILLWLSYRSDVSDTSDLWRGTLAIMVLKTLEVMGPRHGYVLAGGS